MAAVFNNSWAIAESHGLHPLTKPKGQMSYWEWRPLLRIAEQLQDVMVNTHEQNQKVMWAIENVGRYSN